MNKHKSIHGSLCFLVLFTATLITLKITGTIRWSWLWILAPAWIPAAAIAIIVAIVIVTVLVRETTKQIEAGANRNRDLDREAATIGMRRGKGENDRSLANRVKRVRELTGR